MTTTYTLYNSVAGRLPTALKTAADRPDVKREVAYYLSKIESVKSAKDLVSDPRILRFVTRAFGLQDLHYARTLVQRVLEQGVDDRNSLANRMQDSRFTELALTFNFARYGETAMTFTRVRQGTVDKYIRQALEESSGQTNEGVRLALYFARKAPDLRSAYGILADKALLKVAMTALQLPSGFSSMDVDRQASMINEKLKVTDLAKSDKLDAFLKRFTALWDLETAKPAVPLVGSGTGGFATISTDVLQAISTLGSKGRA